MKEVSRSPYDGEPFYCVICTAGWNEYGACELTDCQLETVEAAQNRKMSEVKAVVKKPCIIVDLDGTIADVRHRLQYVKEKPKNWPRFFDACVDDTPHEYVRDLLTILCGDGMNPKAGPLIICSGRPDSHRKQTEDWLAKHQIPYHVLHMRKAGDYRADTIIKKEMLDAIREQSFAPLFAVDDRPEVVQMWRDNGVACFVVDQSAWFE